MDKGTSMQVEILFEKLIKPSSATPDHLGIFKLSVLDQLAPPSYATLLYFYPADGNGRMEATEISRRIEQLQKSLSDVLTRFHPLAGKLTRTKDDILAIDCKDQGVLYMEARLNCQLNEFLEESSEDIDLLTSLAPRKVSDHLDLGIAPLACVQVSKFKCGGLVLAVEILHTVADGFTAIAFTSEWAKISRFGMMSNPRFLNFDIGSILPAIDISNKIKPFPPVSPEQKIVTKRLFIDESFISRLKDEVMEANSLTFMERQPSRVEVVTAFIWRSLIRAAQARHGYLRPSITSLSVNLRGKTALELPENYFGNVYIPVLIKFMADDSSKTELHDFVGLIRDAIKKTLLNLHKASKEDLYSIVIKTHNEMREWSGNSEVDARFATTICRFPLYEADFGWGKPSWVGTPKLSSQMFVLMDAAMGKGIEAWVNLEEVEMINLPRDTTIFALI